jgi:hypothetical protein
MKLFIMVIIISLTVHKVQGLEILQGTPEPVEFAFVVSSTDTLQGLNSIYNATNTWVGVQTFLSSMTISSFVYVTGGGRVGIGTSSPSSKFDVFGGSITVRGSGSGLIVESGNVGIGLVNPTSALQIPSENDAVTPTLSFGDGDSGFYERADDIIAFSAAGAQRWEFQGNEFLSANGLGIQMRNLTPSDTQPIYAFRSDTDTGLGRAAADQLSLISGGVEMMRLSVGGGANNATLNAGNVGIGTLVPSSKLDVADGSITVRGLNAGVRIDGGLIVGVVNPSSIAMNKSSMSWEIPAGGAPGSGTQIRIQGGPAFYLIGSTKPITTAAGSISTMTVIVSSHTFYKIIFFSSGTTTTSDLLLHFNNTLTQANKFKYSFARDCGAAASTVTANGAILYGANSQTSRFGEFNVHNPNADNTVNLGSFGNGFYGNAGSALATVPVTCNGSLFYNENIPITKISLTVIAAGGLHRNGSYLSVYAQDP